MNVPRETIKPAMNLHEIQSLEAQNMANREIRAENQKLKLKCAQYEREIKEHRDTELRFAP